MKCWKCGANLLEKKVGFRAVCQECDSYLHCCVGCRFYKPGLPNSCMVPNTDPIRDRENFNYCEEFLPTEEIKEKNINATDVAKKLFGETEEDSVKDKKGPEDRFNSLFGD
ncbi:MAG: hypothetical protein VX777_09180 [Chlamydiota bacterium]|nr:hypothetical protein [Chlamydiota bacterium]